MKIKHIAPVLLTAILFCQFAIAQDGRGLRNVPIDKLPSKEKRWALIVGIDKYEKDVSSLAGAGNDAKALKDILVNYAGFPESQVVLMTSDAANQDLLPRKMNILEQLNLLSGNVPEDGLFLFSFSGHGVSVGEEAFLIPMDGKYTKNQSLLRDFSIDVRRVKDTVREMRVKQVLMFLDACRNEPGKGDTPNVLTDAMRKSFSFDAANREVKAFATLYATSIGDRAFEFYDSRTKQARGYFSYAIEEAMKGKAANENGEVTLSGLIKHIESTVPNKVKQEKGERQVPSKEINGYKESELVLSIANPRVEQRATNNAAADNQKSGETAFWQAIENSGDAADFSQYLSKCGNGEFACIFRATAELKLSRLKNSSAAAPTTLQPTQPSATLTGTWTGKYFCSQGVTGTTLRLVQTGAVVRAEFEFYPLPESSSTIKSGSGNYQGSYDAASGTMVLNAVGWIKQPDPNWILINFGGSFDASRQVFSGRLQHESCGAIEYRKQDSNQSASQPPSNPATTANLSQPQTSVTLKEIELSFKANLLDEAIQKARIFLTSTPDSKEANAYLGTSLLLKRNVDEAVYYLEKAVLLGEPMVFPVKRGRANPLGLGQLLTDGEINISKDGVVIKDGNKFFRAAFSDIFGTSLENHQNTCPVAFIQGNFVESNSKSQKTKVDKKDFGLFPISASLQQVKQGELMLPMIACTDEGIIPKAIVKLLTSLRAKQ